MGTPEDIQRADPPVGDDGIPRARVEVSVEHKVALPAHRLTITAVVGVIALGALSAPLYFVPFVIGVVFVTWLFGRGATVRMLTVAGYFAYGGAVVAACIGAYVWMDESRRDRTPHVPTEPAPANTPLAPEPVATPDPPECEGTKGKDAPNYFGAGPSSGAYVASVLSCVESTKKTLAVRQPLEWLDPTVTKAYCECAIDTATGRIDPAGLDRCGTRARSGYSSPLGEHRLTLDDVCMQVSGNDAAYCGCYVDGTLAHAKNVDAFCRTVSAFMQRYGCPMPKSSRGGAARP